MAAVSRPLAMSDVAARAGVSHQTVSRVINGHPNVATATRTRVLEAIAELGYRPNSAARALVTGSSRTIGLAISNINQYGPAQTMLGLERAAREAGYFLTVSVLDDTDAAAMSEAVDRLVAQSVDAIVALSTYDDAVRALRQLHAPVPLIAVQADGDEHDLAVWVDQEAGAALATRHLLDLGHRTVHHVSGPAGSLEAEARVRRWRAELARAGAPVPAVLPGDWSPASGYAAGREIVARRRAGVHVSAVFVANDQMAFGLLNALHEAELRVPTDVSVVGFDDVPEAAYCVPPLTTVRQDFAELGRRGVQSILARLGGRQWQPQPVPPQLVVRRTTAPPGERRSRRGGSMAGNREKYVVGVDFGTLSGRAVVVRVADGAELASAVHPYEHAVVERELPTTGAPLPPDWALQVPADWVSVLHTAVPEAVAASGVDPADVVGIGTDFTACTILPTTVDGTPLCELDAFRDRPHAYPKLWKHHAAQPHADRINALAEQRGEAWLARYGGRISSEWEFAKALQLLEEDPEIYAAMDRWVEAADWIVWRLSGRYVRNACTAGYKGIYQDGGYPSREYLAALNPDFAGFVTDKLDHEIGQLGALAGRLTAQAAAWTGLPEGIAVCVGNVDAHVTAPAAQATEPGQLLMVMGTSTCHVMSSDHLGEVPGMCGVVDGGIVPGLWGYEAGQSAVGDIFAWYVQHSVPASYLEQAAANRMGIHEYLTELAAAQEVGEHGLVALDWHGGNRSVLVDHELSGVLVGLTLATRPEDVYRALLEATAYGTRTIIEAFERSDVPVTELVVAGGLLRNEFLMQVYADVCRRPLSVIESDQGPALGSAIHAAVAAGEYPDVHAAARAMGRVRRAAYVPDERRAEIYDAMYQEYRLLHDHFGRGGNDVLHRMRAIRRAALRRAVPATREPIG